MIKLTKKAWVHESGLTASKDGLYTLCSQLKKIARHLKPQANPLSFLLVIGATGQGKTELLRQAYLEHCAINVGRGADIYYNQHGVIIELGETWLNQNTHLLQHTLKRLNRCHPALKISGLILCIDLNALLIAKPLEIIAHSKRHVQLLHRFGQNLGYQVDVAVVLTKVDNLAGFYEFFQHEHSDHLDQPLGFSLYPLGQKTLIESYQIKFDQFIEILEQQVVHKMHSARSSIKRTLIREFPHQLASVRLALQTLIQTLSMPLLRIQALYFTSAAQNGMSQDYLNNKIQHEYGLIVHKPITPAKNHRAYFISGAIIAFQSQTKRHLPRLASRRILASLLALAMCLSLTWVGKHYFAAIYQIEETKKQLSLYETFADGQDNNTSALYYLTQATASLRKISTHGPLLPTVSALQKKLHHTTTEHLEGDFLPILLAEMEQIMLDPEQPIIIRYQTLKIYLSLRRPKLIAAAELRKWFIQHWQQDSAQQRQRKMVLLQEVLRQPLRPITINQHTVEEVRNQLKALPARDLYYLLAEQYFPRQSSVLTIPGFDLAEKNLPIYYTKPGFNLILKKIPAISKRLQAETWVIDQQSPANFTIFMQQVYCEKYVSWWKNFIQHTSPTHFNNYPQALTVLRAITNPQAMRKLIILIQQATAPNLRKKRDLFNQAIANKFAAINILSQTSLRDLIRNMSEFEKFVTTLSLIDDEGKTAFTLTKARFLGNDIANPLTILISQLSQLPDPLASWGKQLTDEAALLLLQASRTYLNQQWQQMVFQMYDQTIAQHYPFDSTATQEVSINDFNQFFSPAGTLSTFIATYLKPFLDTSRPQWQLKTVNHEVLPLAPETIQELMRANVITSMFFADRTATSQITFKIQKLSLDPIIARLHLTIGEYQHHDHQNSDYSTHFVWPSAGAQLVLDTIDGKHLELSESGTWAFFKLLQKMNILVDENDSSKLKIIFEINGNSGHYLLKTQNSMNPFMPSILNGFILPKKLS